jgi:hypothetical protein
VSARATLGLCAQFVLAAAAVLGCSHKTSAPATSLRLAPPIAPFVAPQAWRPKRGGAAPVPPPDLDSQTWQVLVDQYEPHQKQTPQWQALPARDTVEIAMPAGSRIRCVAAPLEVTPEANDFESQFEEWLLSRSVLCSSDGFQSWSSYPHRLRLRPDGTRQLDYRADAWLSERASDGSVRNTVLSLRDQAPTRAATTGPPRILASPRP